MPNEFITNIRHLETFPEERVDFRKGVIYDVPRMLTMISVDTLNGSQQRIPFNYYMNKLSQDSGNRHAKTMLYEASDMPVFHDAIDEGMLEHEKLWIGAKRLNPMELAGSVLVQKEVSIVDENDNVIVDNGVIVEAVTKPELKHELPAYYAAGIAVANSMAKDGEVVFSIETAESYVERQSRIERWIKGKLKHDDIFHDSVFSGYSYKSDPVALRRTDFGDTVAVPAVIFTDSKPTIDLTASS